MLRGIGRELYVLGIMSWGLCPGDYVLGYMSWGICPGVYVLELG